MYNQSLPNQLNWDMSTFNLPTNWAAALPARPFHHLLFSTYLHPVRCIFYTLVAHTILKHILSLETAAQSVPLVLLAVLVLRYTCSSVTLPEAPKLKGLSFLKTVLLSMIHDAPGIIDRLLDISTDGISYASVAGNVLVFVHDTAMIRQLLAMPEEYVTR